MVASLTAGADPGFVDWMEVERIDEDVDVGLHRHWLDPMTFAEVVVKPAHGLVVTSATLSDGSGDLEADWRPPNGTGADALARPAIRAQAPSPFDYPAHTRVFIVNDVHKDDMTRSPPPIAFLAAGGDGLEFTAINACARSIAARGRSTTMTSA